VDELRLHVVHKADDGVCEQGRALKQENGEQSPEEGLCDVDATGLASGLLRIAFESPGGSGRNLELGRKFGVEDGREARWQVVLTLILHRHLLVELALGDGHRGLLALTGGRGDRVHVAVDLGLEVLVECRGVERVERSGALVALAALHVGLTVAAAPKAGHEVCWKRPALCGGGVVSACLAF
jgi:hypothetical protein